MCERDLSQRDGAQEYKALKAWVPWSTRNPVPASLLRSASISAAGSQQHLSLQAASLGIGRLHRGLLTAWGTGLFHGQNEWVFSFFIPEMSLLVFSSTFLLARGGGEKRGLYESVPGEVCLRFLELTMSFLPHQSNAQDLRALVLPNSTLHVQAAPH